MSCSCCGQDKPTVALRARPDVTLCRDCAGWLNGQLGVISTPILPVSDMGEAIAFYERAGFGIRVYNDGTGAEAGFAFVDHEGQSVFDLDTVGDLEPGANNAGCYLVVDDADIWHERLFDAGLAVTPVADQPWGMREFEFDDPSGNHIRVGRAIAGDD